MKELLLIKIIFFSSLVYVHAQVKTSEPAIADTLKKVEILSSDRYGFKKNDSLSETLLLVGKVKLKQDHTLFYADSAIYNRNTKIIEAFGNVHINDNDTTDIYSDYLLYHVDTKMANLKKKVRLTDGKSNLYTEELVYDVNQRIGVYTHGGKVVNGSSVLTSQEGTYYADLKDVYFKKDVNLKDPKYTLTSDSLLYNTTTQLATFISKTYIVDSAKRTILTSEGYYDLKNRNASFGKRPIIHDGATIVIANDIQTDDKTGINILTGNAVFKDTAQGIAVLANSILSNRNEGWFLATQKPLLILKQENDSTFIAADTLYSGKISQLKKERDSLSSSGRDSLQPQVDKLKGTMVINTNDSADRFFRAYSHVRIFSDSLQAVCDSLFYSGEDSIFRLFKDPIVWASASQVTGDTIYLYTKNKKADRMYVFEDGFIINRSGDNMYNQIRGNRLNGFFKDGEIDYMRAKGNAESVYYVKDGEDKLVGINKATADIIDMRFVAKELNKVVFISDVKGTMFPVSQITEQDKILRNFKWQDDIRPKTKFELFGD